MRKSSLILLLAMVFVFATVAAAVCETNMVRCNDTEDSDWRYGLQINMSLPEEGSCPQFDYELGSSTGPMSDCQGGYCDTHGVNGALLKLCECEDIINMPPTDVDGPFRLRLTITSPTSGVYWTDWNTSNVAAARIGMELFEDDGEYCPDFSSPHQLVYQAVAPLGQSLMVGGTACNSDECCFTCDNEKVTVIETVAGIMGEFPLELDKPIMMIDIPTMVWDPNLIEEGDKVTVLIEVLGQCGVICTSGKVICSGEFEVGTFTKCMDYPCNMCLPYIMGNITGDAWTGIAVTNPTSLEQEAIITFYAGADAEGDLIKYTHTIDIDPYSVGSFVVQYEDFAGDLPETLFASVALSECGQVYVINQYNGGLQGYFGLKTGDSKMSNEEDANGQSNPCSFCGLGNAGSGCCD